MSAIGLLAAGVAHEINNPIGFVNANLGTLRSYFDGLLSLLSVYETLAAECDKDSPVLARLQQMRQAIDIDYVRQDGPMLIEESLDGLSRVRKIVQDLKRFAHVDLNPAWETADIHECIDSALNIANNEIKYRATVRKNYGNLPPVECLPSQLGQVFLNLLVNAAQAIPEGERGEIDIRTGVSGDSVWIEIVDNGRGISPEHQNRIFDPFFTTKPVGEGTGLGLSLSYGIVKTHNGMIAVCSEQGKGTIFHISLPIRRR